MESDDEKLEFKCDVCAEIYKNIDDLNQHASKKHSESSNEDGKMYICKICHKVFRSYMGLQHHTVRHTENRPYTCERCGRAFYFRSELKRHSLIHTGERPLECKFCNKTFRHYSVLARHLEKSHKGAQMNDSKAWICKSCDKAFDSQRALNIHKNMHTEKLPDKWICIICNEVFESQADLKNHSAMHTENPSHEYETRGKVFHSSLTLNKHLLSHTNKSPSKCEICHKTFGDFLQLKNHTKTHVDNEQPEPYEHSCEVCGRKFKYKAHISAHKKWSHNAY